MEKEGKKKKPSRDTRDRTGQEGQYYDYPPRRPPKRKKSQKPKIAGGLLIVVAVLGMLFSLMMIGSGFFLDNIEGIPFSDGGTTDIEGRVINNSGEPIEGVTISIIDTDLSTTTDSSGYYDLADVPNGFQEIRVERNGYKTIIYKTYIHSGESTSENYHFGDVEIDRDGTEIDFTMDQGTGTNSYGFDRELVESILGGLHGFLTFIGVVTLICSIVALIGGIFALKRENYGIVVAGSVVGIFSFGFAIGSILAIIALFVLLLASDEFD